MNRKKKIIQLHKNSLRNPEKRLQNSKKEKYISKADRVKLALEADKATLDNETGNNPAEQ